jgi:hypothetical protein
MSQKTFDKFESIHARLIVLSHAIDSLHSTYGIKNEFSIVTIDIASEISELLIELRAS